MSYLDAGRIDRLSYQDSPVHRLDPRAKILATVVFIAGVVSHRPTAITVLIPYLLYPLFMAILGSMPLGLLLRRVLIAMPLVALVGIWNPILDRTPEGTIAGVAVSRGMLSFVSIMIRGLLCVMAALTLAGSTPFPRLIQALRSLRVPQALTVQLMVLYRYLFLLADEAQRMRRARSLRGRASLRSAGAMLSVLLLRTLDRGEDIWRAMKARGFDGEIRSANRLHWRPWADTVFVAEVALLSIGFHLTTPAEVLQGVVDRVRSWP